jgi:peroxiredoxin
MGGPLPGELAIDFTLKDIHGSEYTLSKLLGEKPVVMIFGSFT